jgi:ribosome maturation factor RimP
VYSEKFTQLLMPLITALDYECVGCEFVPQDGNALLRIFIDVADRHVAIEDCEKVSREVSAFLDVEDTIPGRYRLEVSSPGFDRPLFVLAHFVRFVGSVVNLQAQVPVNGRRKFKGPITSVDGDLINVNVDGTVHSIPFADIQKARLVPDYSADLGSGAREKSKP